MRNGAILWVTEPVVRGLVLCGLIVCGLAACGGAKRVYEGPRMPADEVAHVTIKDGPISAEERFKAKLITFDGVPARSTYTELEVLPGEHTLHVTWERYRGLERVASGSVPMTFELRAGFTYRLFWAGGEQPMRFRERPIGK
jgi:hypothetical protein